MAFGCYPNGFARAGSNPAVIEYLFRFFFAKTLILALSDRCSAEQRHTSLGLAISGIDGNLS
jgi:hypothetical protein